jgi:adenosylcobinamide-GDP ribazoletransferase
MKYFWTALAFLTIFPTPKKYSAGIENLGESAIWFPVVGLLIGGLTALAFSGFQLFLPTFLGSALTVWVWIVLTGGLHLDGLADCCDGMLNASSAERRLEIMKDPRIGTFGAIGLVFVILLKVAAVDALEINLAWIAFRWRLPHAGCCCGRGFKKWRAAMGWEHPFKQGFALGI